MKVGEVLLEFYKANNDYHDKKEQMVWLASTFYIGLIGAIGAWILVQDSLAYISKVAITIAVSIAFAFSETYVIAQNWYKAKSVFICDALTDLIQRFDHRKGRPTFVEAIRANAPDSSTQGYRRLVIFWNCGITGILLISAIFILTIGEILYLYLAIPIKG